jgi:germination protein M
MRVRHFGRPAAVLAAVALSLGPVACGDDSDQGADTTTSTTTSTTTTTATTTTDATDDPEGTATTDPAADTVRVGVFFVRDEQVTVDGASVEPPSTARGSLEALLAGPDADAQQAGMTSAVPEGTQLLDVSVDGGNAVVDLSSEFVSGGGSLSMQLRAAQVVFTLTQFDTVDTVTFRIDGAEVDGLGGEGIPATRVDRAEFANVTPLVLVTSPLPGDEVTSPLTARGTSNTFEATVLYELLGPDGEVLDEGFTTATAGSGTWGDFSFEVSWAAGVTGTGTLVAFQENMEDGGRQDVHEVPIDLG